jgi:hypothetical protein
MAVANTQGYYDVATIKAVKSLMHQKFYNASLRESKKIILPFKSLKEILNKIMLGY